MRTAAAISTAVIAPTANAATITARRSRGTDTRRAAKQQPTATPASTAPRMKPIPLRLFKHRNDNHAEATAVQARAIEVTNAGTPVALDYRTREVA